MILFAKTIAVYDGGRDPFRTSRLINPLLGHEAVETFTGNPRLLEPVNSEQEELYLKELYFILLPTSNGEKKIRATLDALREQIAKLPETSTAVLIVGTNFSRDRTEEVVENWIAEHSEIRAGHLVIPESAGRVGKPFVQNRLVEYASMVRDEIAHNLTDDQIFLYFADDDVRPVSLNGQSTLLELRNYLMNNNLLATSGNYVTPNISVEPLHPLRTFWGWIAGVRKLPQYSVPLPQLYGGGTLLPLVNLPRYGIPEDVAADDCWLSIHLGYQHVRTNPEVHLVHMEPNTLRSFTARWLRDLNFALDLEGRFPGDEYAEFYEARKEAFGNINRLIRGLPFYHPHRFANWINWQVRAAARWFWRKDLVPPSLRRGSVYYYRAVPLHISLARAARHAGQVIRRNLPLGARSQPRLVGSVAEHCRKMLKDPDVIRRIFHASGIRLNGHIDVEEVEDEGIISHRVRIRVGDRSYYVRFLDDVGGRFPPPFPSHQARLIYSMGEYIFGTLLGEEVVKSVFPTLAQAEHSYRDAHGDTPIEMILPRIHIQPDYAPEYQSLTVWLKTGDPLPLIRRFGELLGTAHGKTIGYQKDKGRSAPRELRGIFRLIRRYKDIARNLDPEMYGSWLREFGWILRNARKSIRENDAVVQTVNERLVQRNTSISDIFDQVTHASQQDLPQHGVVGHFDYTPKNVMFAADGRAKVHDFEEIGFIDPALEMGRALYDLIRRTSELGRLQFGESRDLDKDFITAFESAYHHFARKALVARGEEPIIPDLGRLKRRARQFAGLRWLDRIAVTGGALSKDETALLIALLLGNPHPKPVIMANG